MRKLFIIGSVINPREGSFTYVNKRTCFTPEERLRQTVCTIVSTQNRLPDADIIVADASDNADDYKQYLESFGIKYINIKNLSEDAQEKIVTHRHKSYCECLLVNTVLESYYKMFKKYDFIVKLSGRYFHTNIDEYDFTPNRKNSLLFKSPMCYEWNNNWNYSFVDLRHLTNDNYLRQYCTALFAFGINRMDSIIEMNDACMHILNRDDMQQYDVETLYYYLTRSMEKSIVEVNWKIGGWLGASGDLVYY